MKTTYPHTSWEEQDPCEIWQGILRGIHNLKNQELLYRTSIIEIGLSDHMNGMIPVNTQGEAVYNRIFHSDNRSEQYCLIY